MNVKAAKWIFWGGTLVSLVIFLGLTVDTHRQFAALTHADRLDDNVVAGKRVFEKYNCNDCHTILGFGGYYAPDLTRAHSRIGEDGIRRRVANPEVVFAASYRKMPQQHVTAPEIESLVAFLRWVDAIDNHDWPPQDSPQRWTRATERLLASATVSPAAALVEQEGCLTCHALGSRGEKMGPRLEWIGAKRSAAWIAEYLANPQKYSPGAQMTDYAYLSASQRAMLGEFITSLAAGTGR